MTGDLLARRLIMWRDVTWFTTSTTAGRVNTAVLSCAAAGVIGCLALMVGLQATGRPLMAPRLVLAVGGVVMVVVVAVGQVWSIAWAAVRHRHAVARGDHRRRLSSSFPFVRSLPASITVPVFVIAASGWITVAAMLLTADRGVPVGPTADCEFPLRVWRALVCVSDSTYLSSMADQQHMIAAVVMVFMAFHLAVALDIHRARRTNSPVSGSPDGL